MDEDSINPLGALRASERPQLLEPLVRGSVAQATDEGASLTLIRPKESRFYWTRRRSDEIEAERVAYQNAARQQDLFDEELAAIEPCPFDFRLKFSDEGGSHDHHCEDWETEAAFWKLSREYGEEAALQHLDTQYNEKRPARGLLLALGNMAARPQTWLLLGLLSVPAAGPVAPQLPGL